MAYRLKNIFYENAPCHILLQNENGPCPLIAAANALLLRKCISLDSSFVRANVIGIEDLITVLVDWALQRNALHQMDGGIQGSTVVAIPPTENPQEDDDVVMRKKQHQHQVDEMMSFLPALQYGLDVNPKFAQGPGGCEYTVGVTTFDVLGVDLVHGWLVDPQDEATHSVLKSKSYNEVVELVIQGNEVDDELTKIAKIICDKQAELKVFPLANGLDDVDRTHMDKDWVNVPGTEDPSSNKGNMDCRETTSNSSEADGLSVGSCCGVRETIESLQPTKSATENVAAAPVYQSKHECSTSKLDRHPLEFSNVIQTDTEKSANASNLSKSPPELSEEIAELRSKHLELEDKSRRGHIIKSFLDETAHQLTYYGLEKLREYIGEKQLCVFFRNNHFSTIVKNEGKLFLLVTDLGYANVTEVVWENLDVINGDTDYVDCFFQKTKALSDASPIVPVLNPEHVLAQKGQQDCDYQLALRLQGGKNINDSALDEEEAALVAAATEASLKTYNGIDNNPSLTMANGAYVSLPPQNNEKDQGNQEKIQQNKSSSDENSSSSNNGLTDDSDRSLALALQAQFDSNDSASEQLARRLQEEEQRALKGREGGNSSTSRSRAPTTSNQNGDNGSCCVS
mmetsp:Transcript_29144/g.43229  ORF Transcript_29144/g.43229 Transcript_29144/m.43229 type:complete len:626 (+) Transcript_29144:205-2082(+)